MSLFIQRSFTMGTKESGKIFRNVNLILEGSAIISSGRLGNSLIARFLYVSLRWLPDLMRRGEQ